MKILKFLVAFLVISLSFTACGKKKAGEVTDKGTTKVEKKADIKANKKADVKANKKALTIKKSKVTEAQINKLSEIFAFGDALVKERKGYQHEIAVLSPEFKKVKTPFKIKANSKHKFVGYSYFADSVWVTIYPDAASMKARKGYSFWITISYKHSIDENGRKSYREKFAGYPAKHFKDAWAWLLLKGDIEVKVSGYTKEAKSDKAMEAILKDFNLKAMGHIFDKKTKYPKLKAYFLKIKAINAKINAVNAKFKAKEKEGADAIKPFITNEGILKDLDLSRVTYYNSNTFLISVKKAKKFVFTLTIGRPGVLGLLSYFKDKNLKRSKVGGFDVTTLKDNLAMIKLPKVSVKASTYYKTEFKNAEKLKEAILSLDIAGLAKVK